MPRCQILNFTEFYLASRAHPGSTKHHRTDACCRAAAFAAVLSDGAWRSTRRSPPERRRCPSGGLVVVAAAGTAEAKDIAAEHTQLSQRVRVRRLACAVSAAGS